MAEITLQDRVANLLQRYGSYRAAADATGLDAAYLYRIRTGAKLNPSGSTCKKLGLIKRVAYEVASDD